MARLELEQSEDLIRKKVRTRHYRRFGRVSLFQSSIGLHLESVNISLYLNLIVDLSPRCIHTMVIWEVNPEILESKSCLDDSQNQIEKI